MSDTIDLTLAIYNDENKAREHLEALQWPNGPVCPHCGNYDATRIRKMMGKSTRPGVYKCNECTKPFSVTVGTVFERSHIPLNKWLLAVHLLSSSKKGISAHQLWRMLNFGSYRTAWFMAHRIREAMKDDPSSGPLGGEGKVVEADETYFGDAGIPHPTDTFVTGKGWVQTGRRAMHKVVALVERNGRARAMKVDRLTAKDVRDVLVRNVDRKSHLMTDEALHYTSVGKEFASHQTVIHSQDEYVRGSVYTNTVEGFFSVFKRGMKGVYQHCGEQHLDRYLTEFSFRHSNRVALGVDDTERTARAIRGAKGKRLTYRRIDTSEDIEAKNPPF
ncbi:MAG: IS1595 family transposase [Bauldia sp.]